MAGFSDYVEGKAMAALNGEADFVKITSRYTALFNGDPTDTGTGGTEVTTTIRTAGRVLSTFTRNVGVLTSNADVDYGVAVGAATVSYWAEFDALSAGNMLFSGPLVAAITASISGNTMTVTAVAPGAAALAIGTPIRDLLGNVAIGQVITALGTGTGGTGTYTVGIPQTVASQSMQYPSPVAVTAGVNFKFATGGLVASVD